MQNLVQKDVFVQIKNARNFYKMIENNEAGLKSDTFKKSEDLRLNAEVSLLRVCDFIDMQNIRDGSFKKCVFKFDVQQCMSQLKEYMIFSKG